jgi:hypothetical protein
MLWHTMAFGDFLTVISRKGVKIEFAILID